jgi:hypothetical protein
MKKYILSLGLFILTAYGLQAQVRLGVKGNITLPFSKQQEVLYDDPNDFLLYRLVIRDVDVSPGVGLMGYVENKSMFFQAEVLYNKTKTNFSLESFIQDDISNREFSKTSYYIGVPIIAGFRISNFKFGVGPKFSFVIDDTPILQEESQFEEKRSSLEKGFTFNFGLKIKRLHFDINYETRFDGTAEYFYFRQARAGFRGRPEFISFGVGVVL